MRAWRVSWTEADGRSDTQVIGSEVEADLLVSILVATGGRGIRKKPEGGWLRSPAVAREPAQPLPLANTIGRRTAWR